MGHAVSISQLVPPASTQTFPKPSPKSCPQYTKMTPNVAQTTLAVGVRRKPGCYQKHVFSISQLVPPASTQTFPKPSPKSCPPAYQNGYPRCSSNHTGCWCASQTWLLPKTCFFHLPTGAPSLPNIPKTISKIMSPVYQNGDPKCSSNHTGC